MVFHVIWCYILVIKYDLNIVGVGIASSLSNFLIYTSVLIYTNSIEELKPAMK
jgi:Na+-driven multidrug efflux pump